MKIFPLFNLNNTNELSSELEKFYEETLEDDEEFIVDIDGMITAKELEYYFSEILIPFLYRIDKQIIISSRNLNRLKKLRKDFAAKHLITSSIIQKEEDYFLPIRS